LENLFLKNNYKNSFYNLLEKVIGKRKNKIGKKKVGKRKNRIEKLNISNHVYDKKF